MLNQLRHIAQAVLIALTLCVLAACRGVPQTREILFTTIREYEQIIALDRDSGDVQPVFPESTGGRNAAFPVWSPQGDAILYWVWDWDNEKAEASLWLMEPDGANPRCVASSFLHVNRPPGEWSFDGRYVAYRTGADRRTPSTWNLMIADATTLEVSEIITGAWGYAWSPTEHLVAVCRWAQDASGLYVLGVDGLQQYALTITETQHLSQPLLCDSSMVWRPNSWEITFACEPTEGSGFVEICTVDPRSGKVQTLTQGQSNYLYRRVSSSEWSPDGQRILFLADYGTSDSEVRNALFVLDTTTGEERELTNALAGVPPVWSPDGREIAFIAPEKGGIEDQNTQVLIVNVQTGQITQLTYDDTLKFSLAW